MSDIEQAIRFALELPEEPHIVTHLREQHPSKLIEWETQIVEYIDALRRVAEGLKRERDLALAHDTQPYPTAWAYEQLCKVHEALKQRCAALKEELRGVREDAEQYRNNWLVYQDLTDEQCMEIALPIVEGWREDAERYRWLRDKRISGRGLPSLATYAADYLVSWDASTEDTDKAIDTARSADGQGGEGRG